MNRINARVGVIMLLIIAAVLSRLFPHPLNFTPLIGVALFGGSQFQHKWQAYLLPLVIYLVSDLLLFAIGQTGFYGITQFFVYGAMVLVTALGTALHRPKTLRVVGYSLSGAAIFWIISNLGVWVGNYFAAGTASYEPGLTLGMTYFRALPFYNNTAAELFWGTFAGALFYTGLLFGLFALAQNRYPQLNYSHR